MCLGLGNGYREPKETEAEEVVKTLQKILETGDQPVGDRFFVNITTKTVKDVIDLINEQQEAIDGLTDKLEGLLCQATGGKLSYSSYPKETMLSVANDYVNECYYEGQTEAVKEFAEKVKAIKYELLNCMHSFIGFDGLIDNLVKEVESDNQCV